MIVKGGWICPVCGASNWKIEGDEIYCIHQYLKERYCCWHLTEEEVVQFFLLIENYMN